MSPDKPEKRSRGEGGKEDQKTLHALATQEISSRRRANQ